MDKNKAIELLKQALTEIPKLKAMHYDNQEFKLWLNKIETIIKHGFDEDDYNTFSSVQDKYFIDDLVEDNLLQEVDYPQKLNNFETALKSIIQRYEILGIVGEGDKGGEVEKMDLLTELIEFCRDLKRYRDALINPNSILRKDKKDYPFLKTTLPRKREGESKKYPFLEELLPQKSKEELIEELREKLLLEHGVLKDEIAKLIRRTDINQFNKTWTRALSPVFGTGENKDALSLCIDYSLEAIGRLDKEEERLLQESLEKPKYKKVKEVQQPVNKDEKSAYQKIWSWINTHRILSILAALAAIATIISVVFSLI